MTSILKVDQLQDSGGNAIITSDGSGNLTTQKLLYPAWMVYLSSDQSSSDAIYTKVQFDTKLVDTDNMYDNTTNYRVTIPSGKAGKYYVESTIMLNSLAVNNLVRNRTEIYKNGSRFSTHFFDARNNYTQQNSNTNSLIMDLAVNDYIEIFGYVDTVSGAAAQFRGAPLSTNLESWFQGYRIGD